MRVAKSCQLKYLNWGYNIKYVARMYCCYFEYGETDLQLSEPQLQLLRRPLRMHVLFSDPGSISPAAPSVQIPSVPLDQVVLIH